VPGWRAGAAALFGVALMLFGLETMGGAAAPLRTLPWFHALTLATAQAPLLAFAAGILIAVVLQSNTGAALLIITLASNGTLDFNQSVMMIFGTNLGAIPLRALLSAGMRGTSARLVRLEDGFCAMSGLLMIVLFYLETWTGWPLVRAAAGWVSADPRMQLATVFLISNAVPALLITPLLAQCWHLLQRLLPQTPAEHASQPKYINPSSLADPATAMNLAALELARLANHVRAPLTDKAAGAYSNGAFAALASELDRFLTQIPADARSQDVLARLPILREGLASVRYIEQSVEEMQAGIAKLSASPETLDAGTPLIGVVGQLLEQLGRALHTRAPDEVDKLRSLSRAHAPALEAARAACQQALAGAPPERVLLGQALIDDAGRIAWMVHRLSKLASLLSPTTAAPNAAAR
jgi:phosphate:Na+ symporter